MPAARIYAFEPSPHNLGYLQKNIRRNDAANVTVISTAIGRQTGMVGLNLPPSGSHSTVNRHGIIQASNVARVPITSLDRWSAENGVQRIDFIKIDVEGFEQEVLAGAAEILVRHKPLVLMEFNSVTITFEAGISPWVFARALASVFDIFSVDEGGDLRPISDLRRFVLGNMTERGCIDDIVLRPCEGVTVSDIRKLGSAPHDAGHVCTE